MVFSRKLADGVAVFILLYPILMHMPAGNHSTLNFSKFTQMGNMFGKDQFSFGRHRFIISKEYYYYTFQISDD